MFCGRLRKTCFTEVMEEGSDGAGAGAAGEEQHVGVITEKVFPLMLPPPPQVNERKLSDRRSFFLAQEDDVVLFLALLLFMHVSSFSKRSGRPKAQGWQQGHSNDVPAPTR